MTARARPLLVALLLVLLAAGALGAVQRELSQPADLHASRYVQAAQCARCHPDHSTSFARTFHRTMTQSAERALAAVDLSAARLDYFGVLARVERDARGAPTLHYQLPGAAPERFVIEKTVGSRRYQQYIARRGRELVRLPIAYHIEEQRWFHMNGAFLTPDPELPPGAALARADYERHVTRWNDNCIFCHNVAPNPGKRPGAHGAAEFESEVAELGIACEACHGPGGEHAARNANPLRRYVLRASERGDPTIVNPARLSDARSLDVCGRCHGQRITDDVERFLRGGDPFLPGEDLALYSAPLWRDTTLHGEPAFEARFWSDGTPRLTAYEYQGVLLSPCAQRGRLTCLSCHGMHEGDPRGQLRPARQGAAMCTQCHDSLAATQAQAAHAHHAAGPTLPTCTSCHMPRIVYGVLDVHPSHRIESPAPARQAAEDRPDACSLCHTDKTRAWAARERVRLFGPEPGPPPPAQALAAETERDFSETERTLFRGDPIQRALAAAAYGQAAPASARARSDAQADAGHARDLALLLEVMENDPYPAIRHLAQRSARNLLAPSSQLARYVPETPHIQRMQALAPLRHRYRLPSGVDATIQQLRAEASARAIEIGE